MVPPRRSLQVGKDAAANWGDDMKKMLIGLTALLTISGAHTAGAVVPDHVRHEQWVMADWVIPTGTEGRYLWYGIEGRYFNEPAADGARTIAMLIKGTCKEVGKNGLGCRGRGAYLSPFDGTFEVAPDASAAHIATTYKGKDYRADLAATFPLPGFYQSFEFCMGPDDEDAGEGQGGGLMNIATADGVFADEEMPTSGGEGDKWGFNLILNGAMVTECEQFWPRYRVAADGTVRATWHVPAALFSGR